MPGANRKRPGGRTPPGENRDAAGVWEKGMAYFYRLPSCKKNNCCTMLLAFEHFDGTGLAASRVVTCNEILAQAPLHVTQIFAKTLRLPYTKAELLCSNGNMKRMARPPHQRQEAAERREKQDADAVDDQPADVVHDSPQIHTKIDHRRELPFAEDSCMTTDRPLPSGGRGPVLRTPVNP